MSVINLEELEGNLTEIVDRVRRGEHISVRANDDIIEMRRSEPSSSLDELIARGVAHRSPHGTGMPSVIEDIADVPSLSEVIIHDRQEETR